MFYVQTISSQLTNLTILIYLIHIQIFMIVSHILTTCPICYNYAKRMWKVTRNHKRHLFEETLTLITYGDEEEEARLVIFYRESNYFFRD